MFRVEIDGITRIPADHPDNGKILSVGADFEHLWIRIGWKNGGTIAGITITPSDLQTAMDELKAAIAKARE
ncbi:hypothetical protein LCGC14_1737130 [marine sediment metagenome]|uniref:Uncharacterized protein n=1 Tax=marine sediment metagenome TaxID=412755 RepID=A0A0F9K7G3_9ZZZZ